MTTNDQDPLLNPPTPDVYFENPRGRFWIPDHTGVLRPFTQGQAGRLLQREYGLERTKDHDAVSPILDDAMFRKNFDFSLAIPGMETGVHEINGRRVLVPFALELIQPAPGDWQTIAAVVQGALGAEQGEWFTAWLASTLQALHAQTWTPGQVVGFIGEPGSCKSLIQSMLTELFGGREARIVQAMSGTTAFNGDWAEAVHLIVEDDFGDSSRATRQRIKETVKAVAVNSVHRIHPKGAQAFSIKPFWRLTISANPVEESLSVLPEIDDSVRNKLSLLWTTHATLPMDTDSPGGRKTFWAQIVSELPAFVDHLLNYSIPDKLRDPEKRCGTCAFHHHLALEAVQSLSPDGQMLSTINENVDLPWEGTASEMLDQLRDHGIAGHFTPKGIGRLLTRLASSHRSRVKVVSTMGNRHVNLFRIEEGGGK